MVHVHGLKTAIAGNSSRTIKEEKERKKEKAFQMWLACDTQAEIAKEVGVERSTVSKWEEDFVKNSETKDFTKLRDFDPPISTSGSSKAGQRAKKKIARFTPPR